jgi:hypothetical protein
MSRHFGSIALAATFAISSCNCGEELTPIVNRGDLRGALCGDVDGQPAGLSVTVTDSEGDTYTATANALGVFVLEDVAEGVATVVIADPAGERTGTIVVTADEVTQFADSVCRAPPPPPTGSVSGCVCDETAGQWVTGANVFIAFENGAFAVSGTDENGCFLLEGVAPGAYELQIQKGVFAEEHNVTIVADETFALPAVESCDAPPPPDDAGTIEGRVCAPDGTTWLSGADVYVELANGTRVATTTDADGAYTLTNVPVGVQVVHIVKGSFSDTTNVTVVDGQTTTIPESECSIEPIDLRIALVTGDYDDVGQVLNTIGVDNDHIEVFASSVFNNNIQWVDDLILDYERLSTFSIVFLNCGAGDRRFVGRDAQGIFIPEIPVDQVAIANLRRFVQEGGSVYASDWAYTVVEAVWPEFVDFAGDETRDAAKVGFAPYDIDATVTDAQMALSLGQTDMELHYPLTEWAVMQDVSPQTTVYVRADAELMSGETLSNVPHTVAFRPGAGRVLFTSFHQEAGINPDMQRILQLLMFEL